MKIHLAYGKNGLNINLPDSAPVTVVQPATHSGLSDEKSAIEQALRQPIKSAPLASLLSPQDTVAIVFSDITRPMPNARVLPVLIEEIQRQGIPAERITLINGLGSHRPQSPAELEQMLGAEIAQSYRIVQHNAWDDANLVETGAVNHAGRRVRVNRAYAEASVRILTGFIEPHFFAGFSGGPKAVLPGIVDIETVLDNHDAANLSNPLATWTVTHGNPVWDEILMAAQSTHPAFLLNVSLNEKGEITGVFAGEMEAAHQAGCAFVQNHATVAVPQLYDLVITSNSGYPLDLNLYQSVKGMSAAARIVKPGGSILMAADCWDGIPEHGNFGRLLSQAASAEDMLAQIFTPGFRTFDQWQAQILAQLLQKVQIYVYTQGIPAEKLRQSLVIPCPSIEEHVQALLAQKPDATIAVMPSGPQTIPFLNTPESSL